MRPTERVKLATRWLTPIFSMAVLSTVGKVTAELVVVIAIRVCPPSLDGRRAGLRRVRAVTTRTKMTVTMTTPRSVVPRYLRPLVTTPKPTVPASGARRQKMPIGAMRITIRISAITTCWI